MAKVQLTRGAGNQDSGNCSAALTRRAALAGALFGLLAPAVMAADGPFPSKPLRFVVPYPPGGIADTMARLLQPLLSAQLGQPVLIDNKSGAGGNLGTEFVAKSAPDGYTILFGASGPLAVNQTLYRGHLGFEPERDLRGVAEIAAFPLVLIASRKVPAANMKEFLAWLRTGEPETYASAGNGTPQHLAAELFARSARVKLVHVPYRGAAQAMVDLIPGRIPFMFEIAGGAIPHIAAGDAKALAVTSDRRLKALPDVPTLAESGLQGFDFTAWNGACVPSGTPDAVVTRLNEAFQHALGDPGLQRKWDELGSLVATGSAASFDALVRSESRRLGALVQELGITVS
jgi:tripartite-type tricarboxylate transporter receptor subunit TctC